MLTRKTPQLFGIAIATVITAIILWLDPQIGFVRPILTLFLVGAVGHTTLSAWASGLHLRGAVWSLMTILLGITLITLGGVFLNFTPWGLQLHSWLLLITGLILFQVIVSLLRRPAVPMDVPSTSVQSWKFELKPTQFVMLFLAVVITGASIMMSRTGALNQPKAEFSQLWMVADDANNLQTTLGIKNEEEQAISYSLVVRQGSTVIHEYPNLLLQANETWQTSLDLGAGRETGVPVEAVLYRSEAPNQVYRAVSLWLK